MDLASRRRLRVALYAHDTQGLGHLRRNLCLAETLARSPLAPDILVCSGVAQAHAFPLPASTDLLTLPGLRKDGDGRYAPRSLGDSVGDLLALRAETLRAALTSFRPDVLVVDKVALGAMGELEPALARLRRRGGCRIVLGLRDILDTPPTARREWKLSGTTEAIRSYYDAVWVYGDPAVADPVREYGLPPDVAEMVTYTGYLAEGRPTGPPDATTVRILEGGPFALCVVGGGQDGAPLVRTFLEAPLPEGVRGVAVTGPLMDRAERAELEALASHLPDREVCTFVSEPGWLIRGATSVAAMAGYNTVCELLEAGTPAVLVPRTRPRREQQVRAERLAAMGLVECLLPGQMDPPELGAALARSRNRTISVPRIDLGGADRIAGLLADVLPTSPTQEIARVAS